MLRHLKNLDWVLITAAVLLAGIGLLALYSISLERQELLSFQKQLIFLGIGLFLMFLLSFFDYRILRNDPHLIFILYFFCLLGLAGLLLFASEIRGVQRWYQIGFISIGPIEFTKIVLLILLAKYFSTRHIEMYRVKHILLSGFYILMPAALVFLQPDLGSVLVLVGLWVAVLIMSGIKVRTFLILALCCLLVFVLAWPFFIKDYQKERVLSFIFPQADPLKAGWSQIQSKIAIGSGGFFGQGFGQGSQTQHGFLPEPQTDFIFAAIAEEFGLFGAIVLILLFAALIWRIVKTAVISQSNFARIFALGFAALITIQIFINIGMNLGILPVMGIPLPFISYGGSSLIAFFIGLGVIQSIRSRERFTF